MVMDPTLPRIKVRDLLMQAFLTGWERSDKSTSQDEYLQSSIQVIEMLQVEPENLYAEEGLGLPDGEEVDHLDDLLRADGFWLYTEWKRKTSSSSSGTRTKLLPMQSLPSWKNWAMASSIWWICPSSGQTRPRPKTLAIPTRCSSAPEQTLTY